MLNGGDGAMQTPSEKIEFVERMSQELSRIAMSAGQPFLAFVLNMAAEEASICKSDSRLQPVNKQGKAVDFKQLLTR